MAGDDIGSEMEFMGGLWKLVAKRPYTNKNGYQIEILYFQNGNQIRSCSSRSKHNLSRVGFREIIKYQKLFEGLL